MAIKLALFQGVWTIFQIENPSIFGQFMLKNKQPGESRHRKDERNARIAGQISIQVVVLGVEQVKGNFGERLDVI